MRADRRGIALIIVVGVLSVLAVIATTFVMMAELERKASRQRMLSVKAYFLARSGIEDALARLSVGQDPTASSNLYLGEDWDASGTLNGLEVGAEIWQTGTLQRECPLKYALRPTFYVRDPASAAKNPALRYVEGRFRGCSGFLQSDAAQTGNTYAIRVEDESTKINVNGGFLDALNRDADAVPDVRDTWVSAFAGVRDPGRGWNGSLTRVLNVLGAQPEVGIAALGDAVIASRPDGGYRSIAELQSAIGTAKDLSPYLTTRSWIDAKVVHPNGYATQNTVLPKPTGINAIKTDRTNGLTLEQNGRAPVNLNGAPRPVLAALVQDLKGTSWQALGESRVFQIDPAMAAAITSEIVTRRATDPFDTWGEFSAFCDALIDNDVITGMLATTDMYAGGNLCGADLLKANFDPNTALNKQMPDQIMWRWIDKSDLSVWSTEGSLGPTGTFLLSSLGRVLDRNGRLMAQRSLSVNVELFRPLRQTTQQDFVAGRALDQYLSLSPGGPFGFLTTGATASWNTWGAGQGLAAITYPCGPTALPGKASPIDGYIGLATVQADDNSPAQGPLMFMHHLDDSLTADVGNPVTYISGAWDGSLQRNLAEDIWPTGGAQPSTFLPDGLHSQYLRSPGFAANGNLPAYSASGNRGVFGYWVKPTNAQKPSTFGPGGPGYLDHIVCARNVDMAAFITQTLAVGSGELAVGRFGIHVENSDPTADDRHERGAGASAYGFFQKALKPDLRWHFCAAWFDTNEFGVLIPGKGKDPDTWSDADDMGFHARGVLPYVSDTHVYGNPYDPAVVQDLLAPGQTFALGTSPSLFAGGANQIIDEVAIYDFGDTGSLTDGLAGILANNRYKDGRYYKGDDARFLSATLEPDPGLPSRLLSVRWTEYLPNEQRKEILAQRNGALVPPYIPLPKGQPRLIDPFLTTARLDLFLLDDTGTLASAPLQTLVHGASIGRVLPKFKYRVRFVNPPADLNKGVLETPFLDDITFLWQPVSGPRITYWQE